MGLMGSALGRGLAGAGAAVSDIANKYIDQNLALQRAQAIADITRTSQVQQAKDIDVYTNSPERRQGLRTEFSKDIEGEAQARLKGKIAESSSPELLNADVARTKAITTATGTAQGEVAKTLGNDPLYIKAERNIARAKHVDGAAELAHAALQNFQLGMARQTAALQDTLFRAMNDGDKETEDRTREKLDVMQGKGGKGEKFAKIAEQAAATMGPALKVLTDPTADDTAKDQARGVLRTQQSILEQAAKRAGFDVSGASKVPEADAHRAAADAVTKGASLDTVNKRLAEQGYKPLPGPTTPAPGAAGASAPAAGTGAVSRVGAALFPGADDPDVQRRRAAVSGIFNRVTSAVGDAGAALAPDWEQQAQSALAYGDKNAIRQVLEQSQGGAKPLSSATRVKLQAALADTTGR